jgi:hypothetical protein
MAKNLVFSQNTNPSFTCQDINRGHHTLGHDKKGHDEYRYIQYECLCLCKGINGELCMILRIVNR